MRSADEAAPDPTPMPAPPAPAARWRAPLRSLQAGPWLVVMAVLLAALAAVCIALISWTRAYVGGESRWSRSQKSATLALVQYATTRDAARWEQYRTYLAVPQGDRAAREALERQPPDRAEAVRGFLQGANDAADVDGMVRLFLWFRWVEPIKRCIAIWARADGLLAELDTQAQALHAAVQAGADDGALLAIRQRVLALDERLTPLEAEFSTTLGGVAILTQQWLIAVMAVATLLLTVLATTALRRANRSHQAQAAALRASQAQRERALRGSSDGFWEWDLKQQTAYFSPRFEELLGYPQGTLAQDVATVKALQHPDNQPAARAALKRHLQDGAPYDIELRMRHRDGRWRWLRSRALSDRGDDGQALRLSGSISDITERREAEDALVRREAMFRSLWETTTDAVLIVDTRHRIQFANPAAHSTFGHAPGALIGRPLSLLQPERMQAAHVAGTARYLAHGTRHLDWRSSEILARHVEGHEMPMEICFSELQLDGQRHFVGFLRDITRRKQAERELQEVNERLEQRVAERTKALTQANERLRELDRLKSEFLATMSHELRTPLNSILGFTDILRAGMSGPLTAEQQRQLGHVGDSGRHLLALINDVLDLSRIESGRMEVQSADFDFAEVAAEVRAQLRPQAQAKGLALDWVLPAALPMRGDRRKVYQVLLNLVNNAVKFTPAGRVQLRAAAADGWLQGAVADSGVGITAAQQAQLFEAFHQLDGSLGRTHEGTGLGLYLSRKLLDLMHGAIAVESTPGRGSTFSFTLPLVLPPA